MRKNIVFVIGFVIIAVVLIVLCLVGGKMLKNPPDEPGESDISVTKAQDPGSDDPDENVKVTEEPENTVTEPEEKDIDMKRTYFMGGCEISDINVVLNKDTNKTYRMDMSEFANDGDTIDSFTFYFDAADGVSSLGEVIGGFGISVSEDCPYATDEKWYQPEDFSVSASGSHCEVTWEIPIDLQEYIEAGKGKVLFGYWWSDVAEIRIDRMVCMKNTFSELPCTGEKNMELDKTLRCDGTGEQKLVIPLSDFLSSSDALQFISLNIEAAENISELKGAFRMTVNGEEYQSPTIIYSGNSNTAKFNWMVLDKIKENIDNTKDLEFVFTGGNNTEIKITNFYAQYSEY